MPSTPKWASEAFKQAIEATHGVPIRTADKTFVSSKDIVYAFYDRGSKHVFLQTRDNPPIEITSTLSELMKRLPGRWTYANRFWLVNVDKVHEVSGRKKHFLLHFEGLSDPVPVSSAPTYLEPLMGLLGVTTLEHPTPYDPVARWLREHDLIDFGFRKALALDLDDDEAVAAFMRNWDIKRFSLERLRKHFKEKTTDNLDLLYLIRNIIWQKRRWIEWGLEEKYHGNIRTFWYIVQAAIAHHSGMAQDVSADSYNGVLNRMIVDERLFKYKDIGFKDLRARFRGIGQVRPWLLLVSEKEGHYYPIRYLATDYGATYACTKGQAPHIMIEYLADELAAGGVDLEDDTLHIFLVTDYDWAGKDIAENFIEFLVEETPIKNVEAYPLVKLEDFTDEEVEIARTPGPSFTYENGGEDHVPYPPGSNPGKLTKAHKWWRKLGDQAQRLHTKTYIGDKWVHTIWKVSADALPWPKIEKIFREKVEILLNGRRRRRSPRGPIRGL